MKFIKNKIQLLLLILVFINIGSCVKAPPEPTEPQLPPITTIGANTFGCKVNGEVIKTERQPDFLSNEGVKFIYTGTPKKELTIYATTKNPAKKINIVILIGSNMIGTHQANKYDSFGLTSSMSLARAKDTLAATVNITNSTVDIDAAKSGDILSGTFDIKLSDGSTIYHLTEGRFDIKIK
jgi:hypothetical protein